MMRNNKILAISLILATFIIAVFTPPPAALVNQDKAAPISGLVASIGQYAMAVITLTPINLTERTNAKSALLLINGTLWKGHPPLH